MTQGHCKQEFSYIDCHKSNIILSYFIYLFPIHHGVAVEYPGIVVFCSVTYVTVAFYINLQLFTIRWHFEHYNNKKKNWKKHKKAIKLK